MNRLNLTLVSLVLLTSSTTAFGDWIYNPSTGHWYQLTALGLTWEQAEAAAVAADGHLVTINDAAEQGWLNANFLYADGQPTHYYIGLVQSPGSAEPGGGWAWVSGQPVTFLNWCCGEPNDGAIHPPNWEQCSQLHHYAASVGPGYWNDIPCDDPYEAGIIERESSPVVPTVSEWGLGLLLLIGTISGAVLFRRRLKTA